MPDVNSCQICGEPGLLVPGLCGAVDGYRLVRDPWASTPSFLDGTLHFSCLAAAAETPRFVEDFTQMLQAGHEEIASLNGTPPPLTRMGLSMTEVFSGSECCVFMSRLAGTWMVVNRRGAWFPLQRSDLSDIARGVLPRSRPAVVTHRLPQDLGDRIRDHGLADLLEALGVRDRYGTAEHLAQVSYEFIDYHPPRRILEYAVTAPLPVPAEARTFLAHQAERPRRGRFTP